MGVLERRRRDDPRRLQTELAFVNAAEELLGEGLSFADLNVSLIATRAKRTRTAFYAHFDDRRALLMRLVEELETEAHIAIEPFLTGDSRADVHAAVAGLLATFRRHEIAARAIVEAAGYDEEVGRFWNGVVNGFADAAQARLQRAGFAAPEAAALAQVLAWMTERSCTQQLAGERPGVDDAALVDALTDTWWRALRPDDATGS